MIRAFPLLLFAALAVLAASRASAEEGMWTFDNFPTSQVEQQLGVHLDQAWLDHLEGASVRLTTGCSAAVVSRDGLALTNQHCVVECAQQLSNPAADYVRGGYLTDTRSEERACPAMQAEVLLGVTDVTVPILNATVGKLGEDYTAAHKGAVSAAEKAVCGDDPALRCQVIGFFSGSQYKVYKYHRYDDVRLVFSPEFSVAFFGGDLDNFTFPRFALDCAFLRLYEHGKPAKTPDFLSWSSAPPVAGEAVFVSGNPSGANRSLTVAELEDLRDIRMPIDELQRSELRGRLLQFSDESPEHQRIAADALFAEENAFKATYGRQLALNDAPFMAARVREEAELKARVAADASLALEIGDPWNDIAQLRTVYAAQYIVWRQLEAAAGGQSKLYLYARDLVRGAAERARPSDLRLPEFDDSRLPLIEKTLFDPQPIEPALERLYLQFWLAKTREYLGADSLAVTAFLGKESPQALAARLVDGSRLADPAVRRALWEGGMGALIASRDPMITFVLKTDPVSRAARTLWDNEVAGPIERADQKIARARASLFGAALYPDATFSLRLSYGKVEPPPGRDGQAGPFTTIAGLYARATDAEPFQLPPRWLAARARLDPATVLDFSTTNDITGGNSGSPVVDAKGDVEGAIFDGNLASIAGDFAYNGVLGRSVAVSTAAITEALTKVYGRAGLVKELEAR
ncbi:MAG TPA: S46 family peptidase [Caulobacteraceae bacterium]